MNVAAPTRRNPVTYARLTACAEPAGGAQGV